MVTGQTAAILWGMGELRLGDEAQTRWAVPLWGGVWQTHRVYNQRLQERWSPGLGGVGRWQVAGGWPTLDMQIGQKVQSQTRKSKTEQDESGERSPPASSREMSC